MAGHGYVPLNRAFPLEPTRLMLKRSMCRSLVVDSKSEAQWEALLKGADEPLLILCPDRSDAAFCLANRRTRPYARPQKGHGRRDQKSDRIFVTPCPPGNRVRRYIACCMHAPTVRLSFKQGMRMVSCTVTGDHLYIVGHGQVECQFSSATEQLDHVESSECGVRTKINVGTV
jgi:hypothetical protein